SVVVYERWRKLKDQRLLDEIERYNEADCVSTLKLQGWLLDLRPAELPWYTRPIGDAEETERTANREAADARIAAMGAQLLASAPDEPPAFRELVSQLLDFHRREAKPAWWRQFQCVDLTEEELIDDAECIGGLRRDPSTPPFREKKSLVHTFVFPPQDFKMRKGGRPRRAGTREPAGEIFSVDEDARRLQLKAGPSVPALGDVLSLIPQAPFDDKVLREAVYRYAESVVAGSERYGAITSVLKADLPRIRGRERGAPI